MGKKNRRRINKATQHAQQKEPEGEGDHVFPPAMLRVLRDMEKSGMPIDQIFHHEHQLSVCDSLGLFQIVSFFTCNSAIRNPYDISTTMSVFFVIQICAHDNIASADSQLTSANSTEFFEKSQKNFNENVTAAVPMKVSFSVCAGLIREALGRMKKTKATLPGTMENAVIRFYGLDTTSSPTKFACSDVLPAPNPAPDVDSLALLLFRPEYCSWYQLADCTFEGKLGYGPFEIPASAVELERAMRKYSKHSVNRDKFYGMVRHMALWHALQKELQVASWLLWELQAMQDYSEEEGEEGAIERLESNILFQIVINQFFDLYGNRGYYGNLAPEEGSMRGSFLTRYAMLSNLASRGQITDGMALTASIATGQERTPYKKDDDHTDAPSVSIHEACRSLKKTGCVVCGATATKQGGKLMQCSACKSKAYCSPECQVAHWKAGHKKECIGNLLKKKGPPRGPRLPVGFYDRGYASKGNK